VCILIYIQVSVYCKLDKDDEVLIAISRARVLIWGTQFRYNRAIMFLEICFLRVIFLWTQQFCKWIIRLFVYVLAITQKIIRVYIRSNTPWTNRLLFFKQHKLHQKFSCSGQVFSFLAKPRYFPNCYKYLSVSVIYVLFPSVKQCIRKVHCKLWYHDGYIHCRIYSLYIYN
jgi:hypothetical protein